MIKPANIVLMLVGTAVVGGGAWCLSHPPPEPKDDWGDPAQVVDGQSYPNNYYVPGAGYYHASYHSFFFYPYNYFDSSRGYYYGGSWWPTSNVTTVPASVPTPSAVAQARSSLVASRTGVGASGRSGESSISRGGFGATARGGGASS